MAQPEIRIGIDVGGTFTDFVVYQTATEKLDTFKLLSTPANPAQVVISGLSRILQTFVNEIGPADIKIVHGSTVATNALLERKGARTALITTRGFRDILQIGRQNRPALYDLFADPPPPLIPSELRFEVDERVDHKGNVLTSLDKQQVNELVAHLKSLELESVAVCLLFSFLHPEHEQQLEEVLNTAGFFTSLSSQVLPEFREYERTSTTTVNAYVTPVLDLYLTDLENSFLSRTTGAHLQLMQSNGGCMSIEAARQSGVRCILSGPAGGIVGAQHIARLSRHTENGTIDGRLITFDMGGTSTDVSLVDGEPSITTESIIGGCPIAIPVLDIHTIGAGGGSIARVDLGGALRVGPQSAGADPGPACYGRGGLLPTVTDANLVLGRLQAEYFLDGEMPLDKQRALQAITTLGLQLGLDPIQTSLGIIEVVNANMERALRLVSVERGHDPLDFTLLSFGGSGGLHAGDLARRVGMPRVCIPPMASTLSAFGMLASNLIKDYSQTVMLPGGTDPEIIMAKIAPLEERGLYEHKEGGFEIGNVQIERLLDMRYRGQSYELTVPLSKDIAGDFHSAHRRTYGYSRIESPIEIVNIRVRVTGLTPLPVLSPTHSDGADPTGALVARMPVELSHGTASIPFYRGEWLRHGNRITGPALVLRVDTTILVEAGDIATVDQYNNLWIEINNEHD